MRFNRFVAFVVAMALSVVPLVTSAADPVEIDVILPLTGLGAFIGSAQQKTLTALAELVNETGGIQGRPIHFTFNDDLTQPQTSMQLTTQALARKPTVIFGSALSANCRATAPLFTNGPVQYCLSPVFEPAPGGYVFAANISDVDLIKASLRYMQARGWKRIATLNTTDASGQLGDNDIATALKLPENKDMILVGAEHFNPTDPIVAAQVAKLKGASPQALIIWAPGTPFGTALHGLHDAGLSLPVMTTSANMGAAQLKGYASFISKDVYFQGEAFTAGQGRSKDLKPQQAYAGTMKAAGFPEDVQGGVAWDPAMIVVDALRKLGPGASASQLRDYLENVHGYVGISGTYDFRGNNQRGLSADDVIIERWDPDKADFIVVSKFGGSI
jgi:branched-chain amino acid transport system substrate-binding protein